MRRKLALFTLTGAVACLAPATARAQDVILDEDFETGSSSWTLSTGWYLQVGAVPGCFRQAPPPFGTTAARFGIPGTCTFGANPGWMNLAQAFTVPAAATAARLRFMSYEETECGTVPMCGYDNRFVLVAVDGSSTWTEVWAGGISHEWIEKSVDLSAWIGQSIRLRFLFDPVDWMHNEDLGWMVDDVSVEIDSPGGPQIYCTPKINSLGCGPLMSYSGDVSLSGPDDLVFATTNLRNNVFGSFAWSTGINNVPFQGGTLCVQAPARRTTTVSTGGTLLPENDCSGSYAWHFSHQYLLGNSIDPGETIHCQFFGRDKGNGAPMTLSNAVRATILP